MKREEVFEVINRERNYQDSLWPPHEGHQHSEHCLVSLQAYLRKAEDNWIASAGELTTVQQLAKMAAIIVRALESIPEAEELLTKGLR